MTIHLTWQDNNANEDGHKVYRDLVSIDPGSPPAPIATLAANAVEYFDTIAGSGVIESWSSGTSLPGNFSSSQAVITSSRVYLLGGSDGTSTVSTVYVATLNADGTIGAWSTGTSLPGPLRFSQAVVTSSRVYLLGGLDATTTVATVYYAPINGDGTLGAWVTDTSLPGAIRESQAVLTDSKVYLLGGYDGTSTVSTVYSAPVTAGVIGAWTTDTSLPGALMSSQAVVTGSKVYLLGGHNGTSVVSTVYSAPITAGVIGTWTTDTSLPGVLRASQAVLTDSRVYLLGGLDSSTYIATVYSAPVSAGTIGTWSTDTSIPGAIGFSQAVKTSTRVYLLGGYDGTNVVSTVYVSIHNDPGITYHYRVSATKSGNESFSDEVTLQAA